jgi:hypothetical protein
MLPRIIAFTRDAEALKTGLLRTSIVANCIHAIASTSRAHLANNSTLNSFKAREFGKVFRQLRFANWALGHLSAVDPISDTVCS